MNELDEREFDAFVKQYRTPQTHIPIIKKHFALVSEGESGEHFECRYCGRRFAVVEVLTIVDPLLLLEHPAKGFPPTQAKYGSGQFFQHQCAISDPEDSN